MSFIDFNSLIICNDNPDPQALCDTIKYFRNLGVKNFVITYGLYLDRFCQSEIINTFKSAKARLSDISVRGANIWIYPNVHVTDGILRNPFIKRLKVRSTNLFFTELPMFASGDKLNADINYTLFKQKLFPIFVSFEINLISSPKSFTGTLYKSQNAAFALDLEFMMSSDYEHFLHMAMTSGTTIIPCVSRELKAYSDIVLQFEHLRNRLGDDSYFKLCRHVDVSCKRIFNQF